MEHTKKKMAIIADDFTGAVDTGVKFAEAGAKTITITELSDITKYLAMGSDVYVIDTETRHLSEEMAYKKVFEAASACKEYGVDFLYKKTDSVLRGRLESEMCGAMEGFGEDHIHFVPAYPDMSRYTRNGIQYIGETPIAETSLGKDPFDPIVSSKIRDFFQKMKETEVIIHDADTNEELFKIADKLLHDSRNKVFAGCAGFASAMAKNMFEKQGSYRLNLKNCPFLIVCGSVNQISRQQMERETCYGYHCYSFHPETWMDEQGMIMKSYIEKVERDLWQKKEALVYTDIRNLSVNTDSGHRSEMAKGLGALTRIVASGFQEILLMIIGGDTASEFLKGLGYDSITIVKEIEKGSVLLKITKKEKTIWMISKSGGFGKPDLIEIIRKGVKENGI